MICRGVHMNDETREEWVNNDEALYNWWRSSRQSMRKFVRENREALDQLICGQLTKPPRG